MTIKRWKWWWGWNPTKVEDYLEEMTKRGWKFVSARFAMMIFEFVKDAPKNVRYVLDFNYKNKMDDEYMRIATDAGWEYVVICSGWILWRKAFKEKRPEFFTDNQSIIERNRRLLTFLSIIVLSQIPVFLMYFVDRDHSGHAYVSTTILCIYIPMAVLLFYGIIRLLLVIRSLKRQGRR